MADHSNLQAPYLYCLWDDSLCRYKGDVFEGYAEIHIPGKGFEQGHFFDIQQNGVLISKEDFQERLLALTRK